MLCSPPIRAQQLDFDGIAQQEGTTEEEARRRHHEIGLFDEEGIEVNVGDQRAYITFPYWESLDMDQIMVRIEEAVDTIRRECPDWIVYDPQLDRAIDPSESGDAIKQAFEHGKDQLREAVGARGVPYNPPSTIDAEQEGKRPFWKRVLGRD